MIITRILLPLLLISVLFHACKQKAASNEKLEAFSRSQLHAWNNKLSDVIIKDIFSPPVSSRIYAYTNIAAYEALAPGNPGFVSMAGQLNGLSQPPRPDASKAYYYPVAGVIAFSTVSQKMVLTGREMESYEKTYLEQVRELGLEEEILQNSVEYGRKVGKHILEWMSRDGYAEVKAMPRYVLTHHFGGWEPTPPDYAQAIEPYWNKMRPFALDSASQFKIEDPTPYDTVSSCQFYKESMEVYSICKNIKGDTLDIALFWDDNPNTPLIVGHVMSYRQKLSPGGHWMAITANALKTKNASLMQSAEAFSLVSIALADGFINCWHEKFRLKTIRPETFINRYIDPEWVPTIQTPPFPEYPSGHSMVSGSASAVLTSILGDSFAFTDSSEAAFGLPVRKFESFYAASEEAAISRLYGGIHFMPAIMNGLKHGRDIGSFVVKKIRTRKAA